MINRVFEMNTRPQRIGVVWNGIHRDRAVDHDLVSNPKEGIIVPGDHEMMVFFNDVLDGIYECLLGMAFFICVFACKHKSYEVVVRFVVFVKAISTVGEFPQGVSYHWVVVEEFGHRG